MAVLSLRALRKSFGSTAALDGIEFETGKGEFWSLLGPSGCGKTTTLRCIAGFEYPDSGSILFDGRDITNLKPERRDIGMVFQSYALFPHMTVAENLSFGLEMRKIAAAERARRIARVIEMVQLGGMEQRYPRQLSGGQQQRVALARAVVIEPGLLLLDEPLANLDAVLRDEMRFFIRELQRRLGITSIYVTHDQSEAMVMSDRIVVMFDGVIAQVGTPREIYSKPVSRRVASFIGRSNIISGTIADKSGAHYAVDTAVGRVLARSDTTRDTNSRVDIMIRPESFAIDAATENIIAGQILRAVYVGNGIDLFVRLADGSECEVAAKPGTTLASGDTVRFGAASDDCWILPS